MHQYRLASLVLFAILTICPGADAQIRRTALRTSDYQRAGLEVAWTAQVEIDPLRTFANDLSVKVVGTDSYDDYLATSYPVYEVKYDKGVRRFSAIDLGRNGSAMGADEAARLAEKEKIRLEARGYQVEIEEKRVPQSTLYVHSSSGTIQAIDAENGRTQWALTIGRPNHPTLTPSANDKYVAVINGTNLFLLDRESGDQIWKRRLQNNPTVGPVLTREMVFVPASNGQMEGHWLPNENDPAPEPGTIELRKPTWFYRSDSRITAPITATDATISWPTLGGRMYVADLTEPEVSYMVRTAGAIHGHSVQLPPDRLAIASTDGYVYCVNEEDGLLNWEYSAGEPIRNSLFANGDNVYAVTELGNLHSISSDGFQQWLVNGIDRVVAASESRVYVRDLRGNLQALDPKTGGRIFTLAATGYDLPVVNQATDRIYLASRDGTVTCLREIQAELPTIHVRMPSSPGDEEAADETERQSAPVSPPVDDFSPPAEDDGMFDDMLGDDPMLDDPMEDDPFAPGNEDEDPFGPMDDGDEDPFAPGGDEEDPFDI